MQGNWSLQTQKYHQQKCVSKLKSVIQQTASLVTPHLHKTVMCKMIHCNNKVKQDLQSNMQNLDVNIFSITLTWKHSVILERIT